MLGDDTSAGFIGGNRATRCEAILCGPLLRVAAAGGAKHLVTSGDHHRVIDIMRKTFDCARNVGRLLDARAAPASDVGDPEVVPLEFIAWPEGFTIGGYSPRRWTEITGAATGTIPVGVPLSGGFLSTAASEQNAERNNDHPLTLLTVPGAYCHDSGGRQPLRHHPTGGHHQQQEADTEATLHGVPLPLQLAFDLGTNLRLQALQSGCIRL